MNKTFLGKMLPMARVCKEAGFTHNLLFRTSTRAYASNAYSVKDKFEAAYKVKMAELSKFPPKM
jgi:hypothetical protein